MSNHKHSIGDVVKVKGLASEVSRNPWDATIVAHRDDDYHPCTIEYLEGMLTGTRRRDHDKDRQRNEV